MIMVNISNALTYHPPHLLQGHERVVEVEINPKHSAFAPVTSVHSVHVLRETVVVPVACVRVLGSTISTAHVVVDVMGGELHVSVVLECITC